MSGLPDGYFDAFWDHIDPVNDDDGTSALRLIGEMFATNLLWRDGDYLRSGDAGMLSLTAGDQYLVRRIQDAAEAARIAGAD